MCEWTCLPGYSRPGDSLVPDLVGNGERGAQADVLIDAAAPLGLTHPSHRR